MRRFLAILTCVLILALPWTTAAQIPVTDVAHIAINIAGWIAQGTNWVSQLARMIQQYQQLVQTYDHLKHVAEQLQNPSVYTVVSLFAVVPSSTMTRIETISDFRRILEGGNNAPAALGEQYKAIFGAPYDATSLAPYGPQDWTSATKRMTQHTQATDSAVLELLHVVSDVNGSLEKIHSDRTYEEISSKLKSTDITPHQSTQLGSLSALYTAQSTDKLTQVLAAQAVVQAQDVAERSYWQKIGASAMTQERNANQQSADALRNSWQSIQSWQEQH